MRIEWSHSKKKHVYGDGETPFVVSSSIHNASRFNESLVNEDVIIMNNALFFMSGLVI